MAFVVKTLADCLQSLADRHEGGDLPTDSATLTYWTRLLNRAKDYCADRLTLTKSTSLTTSSGTIVLPDDFISIASVVGASGLVWRMITKEQSVDAGPFVFWITGDQDGRFYLNTVTGADQTFTVYYAYRPGDMSANSDECVIPDSEAVVARAYGNLRYAEFDPAEDASIAMSECERRLDEVIYQRNVNDASPVFTLSSNA